jgi:hypothetical protein
LNAVTINAILILEASKILALCGLIDDQGRTEHNSLASTSRLSTFSLRGLAASACLTGN